MTRASRCIPLLAAALLLALPPLAQAEAPSWRYLEPQTDHPADPGRLRFGNDQSIWSFARGEVRRTDAAGTTRNLTRYEFAGIADNDPYIDGIPLQDGGAIVFSSGCRIARLTRELRLSWRTQLPACDAVVANAQGLAWIAGGNTLYPLGRDGVAGSSVQLGQNERIRRIVATADGGVVALSLGSDSRQAYLRRFDATGPQRWQWTSSADAAQDFTAAGDGGSFVYGITNSTLSVNRLDAAGTVLWSRQHATDSETVLNAHAAAGRLFLATAPVAVDQQRKLLRIEADGTAGLVQSLCGASLRDWPGFSDFTVDADGATATICRGYGGPWVDLVSLLRRDPAGAQTAQKELSIGTPLQLHRLDSGDLVAVGGNAAGVSDAVTIVAATNQVRQQPAIAYASGTRLWAQQIDSDGSSYVLSESLDLYGLPRAYFISKLTPEGALAWRKTAYTLGLRRAALSAADGVVCATSASARYNESAEKDVFVELCLAKSDGTKISENETQPAYASRVWLQLLQGGNRVRLATRPDGYDIVRLNSAGQILGQTQASGVASDAAIDAAGRTAVLLGRQLLRYRADGSVAFSVSQTPMSEVHADIASASDGGVLLYGKLAALGPDVRGLWYVGADGATRWTQPLDAQFAKARILPTADAVYLLQYGGKAGQPGALGVSRVSKHSLVNGAVLWQHDSSSQIVGADAFGGRLALTAAGNEILLLNSVENRLRLERLDTASGLAAPDRHIDCGGICAQPAELAVDAAGTARLALNLIERDRGQTAAVVALRNALTEPLQTRLDQPGVAGLWYSPYANGEGLSIDWLPASRTLFAAWFTYSTRGGNDPAEQRWYTLQANAVAANTRELELPILETTGGNFNAGPAVAPRQVGLATLKFADCGAASLDYRFDASSNEGARGTISLTRLTPATQPCILADGSSQPGAGARPPAKGFESRMSGAWYDEATVGQGLQLNIQPDGVFFAPWFTFDPAGSSNDAGRQHWFTLQGDLAQADSGKVELMLIQTIGGTFDRVPTYNVNIVGSASLRMLGCDSARLDYVFAGDRIAGPFTARTGTLNLKRMGGCAP